MGWHKGHLISFDTETTSKSPLDPDQRLIEPETVGGTLVYTGAVVLTLMVTVVLIAVLLLVVMNGACQ